MAKFRWDDKVNELDISNDVIIEQEPQDNLNACTVFHAAHSPLCPSPKSEDLGRLMAKKFDRFIYLDNNATHPMLESVANKIRQQSNIVGNPSSKHMAGERARAFMEQARLSICRYLNIYDASHLMFVGSATEANNTIIKGVAFKNYGVAGSKTEIITTSVEHNSTLRTVTYLEKFGFRSRIISVDSNGLLNEQELLDAVSHKTALVTIMAANNETGVVMPIHRYVEIIKNKHPDIIIHSDMSQVVGKLAGVKVGRLDAATFTPHKFGGPPGIGLLYVKDFECFDSLLHGGNQEFGKRAGTYNAPVISGVAQAVSELKKVDLGKIKQLRDYLERELEKNFKCRINCKDVDRLVNTTSVTFFDLIGDELIEYLSNNGIFISATSACSSHEKNPSHVLKAMGMSDEEAYRTVRISLNRFNTEEEIDVFLWSLKQFNLSKKHI